MKSLENKVAIVTGAGSGIGKAIAMLYAAEGAKVVVSDINESTGKETASEIALKGGDVYFIRADTSKPTDSQALVHKTIIRYGGLHIACNNAGISGPIAPIGDYPIESWDKVIDVNLTGVFYGLHYQIPAMLSSGGGSIVNISSIFGCVRNKYSPAFIAAKHGVMGLTQTAALEYGDKNIRVNSIGPGYILTPLLSESMGDNALHDLNLLNPIGRLGKAEEVAELALWLSSSKSSFVTGSYYTIDGGYTAQMDVNQPNTYMACAT